MKKILVLGAGYVARPLVDYLLENTDFELTVADVLLQQAQRVTAGRARTTACALDIREEEKVRQLIDDSNLTVSLLPHVFHYQIATACLESKTTLITASYATEDIRALDAEAKKNGILILKEMGLDPGIDHMSAMQIIDDIKSSGGRIRSFKSYCGGLAAPEANTNPWHYKFSWSPRGVLQAAQSSAKYRRGNQMIVIENSEMPQHTWPLQIGTFDLEAYPNRDSLAYIKRYGLAGIETLVRCTLRFPGWISSMAALRQVGFFNTTPFSTSQYHTRPELLHALLQIPAGQSLKGEIKKRAGRFWTAANEDRFTWLGLFDEAIGENPPQHQSALDFLVNLMIDKMSFAENERDMIVLHHDFVYEKEGEAYNHLSTLIEYGQPGASSAMARTVAFPAAIAAHVFLAGKIKLTGVHIPVLPEIYTPVLAELKKCGIAFSERIEKLAAPKTSS